MKKSNLFLFIAFLLSSCTPAATSTSVAAPSQTHVPTQTATHSPANTSAPTSISTPLPIAFIYQDDVPANARALQEQAAHKAYLYYSQYADLGPITIYTFSDINLFIDQIFPAIQSDVPTYTKSKFVQDWIAGGGGNTAAEDIVAISSSYLAWQDNSNLCYKAKTLSHELFHTLQSRLLEHGLFRPELDYGPEWIKEGSAEIFGYKIADGLNDCSASIEIDLWKTRSADANYPLEEVDGGVFSSKIQFWSLAPYAVSYLIKLAPNGEKSVIDYYAGIGDGMSWQESFQTNFGITIEDFYAKFESNRPKEEIDTSVCITQSDDRVKCLGRKANKDFIFNVPSIITTQADQWQVESACNVTGWGLEGSAGHLILQISVTDDTHGSCQVKVIFSPNQYVTVDFLVP